MTHDKNKNRPIRYFLIIVTYNLIISIIGYVLDWLNDNFFHFDWRNWGLIEWWFVVSIMVMIGAFMFYMVPLFDEWLYSKLELRIIKITDKMGKNEG